MTTEVNDNNTHIKLDEIKATLNSIETNTIKTLKQYRNEGKCYGCVYNNFKTYDNGSYVYLNNPSESGKKYYVYNINLTIGTSGSIKHTLSLGTEMTVFGTELQYTNLNCSSLNNSNNNIIGYYENTTENLPSTLSLFSGGFSCGSSNNIYNDFQEEYIEIPSGYCLIINISNILSKSIATLAIRWIEEDA